MNKFEYLFNPRSIAIVGASEDNSRAGSQTVRALKEYGYRGNIYPVNPKYQQLSGYKCYASLEEIGAPVDVAVIAVPAIGTIDVVKSCGEADIPFGVVLGSGFREKGAEGLKLQNLMVDTARKSSVRLIGPNCLGLANIHERAFASFGSLARPPLLAPGPVSMVTQSGGFGSGLSTSCRSAGIGFRILIASGNEADLTAPELINALVDDPGTEIILCYIEGVGNGRALMAAGERALAAGKPILIWKAGNTRYGTRAAATHTANMTGTYDLWKAALRQCGIIEINDIGEAVDYIKVLHAKRFPRGRNVAVISPSGGSGVVCSDVIDKYELALPTPSESTINAIKEALPSAASMNNPIDIGGGGASQDRLTRAFKALLADPDMHQLCILFVVLMGERSITTSNALAEAIQSSDKPVIVFSAVLRETAPQSFEILERANIPVLRSPARVARALRMLSDYALVRASHMARPPSAVFTSPPSFTVPSTDPSDAKKNVLDEMRSKEIVASCGIRTTHDVILTIHDDRVSVGEIDISFPVAVKVLSPDILHKTDVGGVLLNVADLQALQAAAQTVVTNSRRAHPSARIEGVLVSEMIDNAVEVIAGVVNDAVFGPMVLLGMGGVLAEVMHDVTYRVAPFNVTEAHSMIGELRTRKVFDGVRGKPPCDVDALAKALADLSQLGWNERDRILEFDINPLMVRPRGSGVVAADALVVTH